MTSVRIKSFFVIFLFSLSFFGINLSTELNNQISNIDSIYEINSGSYDWIWDEFVGATGDVPGNDIEVFGADFGYFHNKVELYDKLESLEMNFPDLIEVDTIGQSFKGNDIPVVKITNELKTRNKKEFFLVAHHHAREIITLENALYFIDKIVYDFINGDREIKTALKNRIIYVIPSLNIDTLDIMHLSPGQRKNLRPVDEDYDGILDDNELLTGVDSADADTTIGEDLPGGVDLNRNYDFMWDYPGGSSTVNSSEVYRGLAPFSEPETEALATFVRQHFFQSAISLHSGIELVLVPWSYTLDEDCPDSEEYYNVGTILSELTSLGFEDLYPCSGEWGDWMYGARGIFSITLETYGNHYTSYVWDMFNPPANEVILNCATIYPGLKYMMLYDCPELNINPTEDDAFELRTLNGGLEYPFLFTAFSLFIVLIIQRARFSGKTKRFENIRK